LKDLSKRSVGARRPDIKKSDGDDKTTLGTIIRRKARHLDRGQNHLPGKKAINGPLSMKEMKKPMDRKGSEYTCGPGGEIVKKKTSQFGGRPRNNMTNLKPTKGGGGYTTSAGGGEDSVEPAKGSGTIKDHVGKC